MRTTARGTARAAAGRWAWRAVAPVAVTVGLAALPAPDGLAPHAWGYFAIFAGVVVGLVLEPLPGGAIGLTGVVVVTLLGDRVLLSPEQLARLGPKWPAEAIRWALSGFSNATVWLIFGAFMFALGYRRTGLGRRIALLLVRALGRRTLALGYAIAAADLVLAPFTPSNTARSAGTIYPIIASLPSLYGSHPHDPSARRIGGYLTWTAIAATCVTSSLFLTAMAPNLLAVELIRETAGIEVTWRQWVLACAPVGLPLLVAVPLLGFWLHTPEVAGGDEAPRWAAEELEKLGPPSRNELLLAALVGVALFLWVAAGDRVDAAGAALAVLALMIVTGVVDWDDVVSHAVAWNTLAWFATLVALAAGLSQVGFVSWIAGVVAPHVASLPPTDAMAGLVAVFFLSHYLFASVTAHVTALLPVVLAIGAGVPDLPMRPFALLLMLSLGLMGVVTPYATGPSPVYYGSGYLRSSEYWRLGGLFGLIFLAALLGVGVPWMLALD